MLKFTNIFLIACILSIDAIIAHALSMTPQIQRLLDEKQQKIEALEKCEGKKQGWMIAGISTIGLTAVGVVGNVALANKSKSVDSAISNEKSALNAARLELNDVNDKIAAEKQRQEELEKEIKYSTDIHDVKKTMAADSGVTNPSVTMAINTPVADTGLGEPKVDVSKWTRETYRDCVIKNFSEDAKSYWSKSNNGKFCQGHHAGKDLFNARKNPNTCSQTKFNTLGNGEWIATLKNGKSMRGISSCSTSKASIKYELRDNIDMSGDGLNCWCKLTQTEVSECLITPEFSWMFVEEFWLVDDTEINNYADDETILPEYYNRGENACVWQCAQYCGYELYDYGGHKQRALHGVPYIKEFIINK